MARISLLFSLTFFALTVASVFAHEAPIKSEKYSPPCTVGDLKTLPFIEISKLITSKSNSAFKNPTLANFFHIFKDYTEFLAGFSKRTDFEYALHGPASLLWKVKFAGMSHSLLAAQMAFGMDGKGSLKLKKNYQGMIHGFAAFPAKIAEISARHQFNSGAKLSIQEQKEFTAVFGAFKKSLIGYIDTACDFTAKKQVAVGGEFGNSIGGGHKAEFSASASGKVDVNEKKKKKKKAHHKRRSLFAGEDGFRSLNLPYVKHLVGMNA